MAAAALSFLVLAGMKYTSAGALLLRRCVVVLFVAALASGYSNFDAKGPVFNPLDFGAVGDGVHNDTAALQSAIDACSAAKGLVFLPSDHIFRTGSLLLRSDVTLFISSGSTLLGSPVHTDYPLRWRGHYGIGPRALLTSGLCLRRAPNATGGNNGCLEWDIVRNVTIEGGGTIDGSGPSWWFDPGPSNNRMDMIEPWNVDGLTIQDIKLQRSPAWTVHPVMCSNVLVRNISLDAKIEFNDVEYDGHNVDGVDPENCVNVTIENSVIRAGDDCIAIYSMQAPPAQATHNVSVRNVVCYTPLTITHGHDTHDVTFENCTVKGRWGHSSSPLWWPQWFHTGMRLKTGSSLGSTGGTIHDILFVMTVGCSCDGYAQPCSSFCVCPYIFRPSLPFSPPKLVSCTLH